MPTWPRSEHMPDPQLVRISEKTLPNSVRSDLLTSHPRTNLIALVSEHGDVDIYRFGGQRAIHISSDDVSGTISCLQWSPDGDFLFVGTSEGRVEWISVRKGRVVPRTEEATLTAISARTEDDAPVSCLGAAINLIHSDEPPTRAANEQQRKPTVGETTLDWLKKVSDTESKKLHQAIGSSDLKTNPTDLPQHLASVDIAEVLPKLSPIPPLSKNQHGFQPRSTKLAAQKMVHGILAMRPSKQSRTMHVVFTAHENGKARLVLDRIFDQDFPPPDAQTDRIPIKHCSHTSSPYHAILRAKRQEGLAQPKSDSAAFTSSDFDLVLYETPFSITGRVHTRSIIDKSLHFHCLGLYLTYCSDYMATEWTTNTTLPSRFVESINETLAEKGETRLEQHLYQLAMTGYRNETLTEWLRDELAERGHKRWDQAMMTLHHSLGHIFRVNFIPGIERLTLTASTLRGFASYYEGTAKFDVEAEVFTKVINAVGCLQILVHEALRILGDEERQFRAFSRWLRSQIDLSATEPGSQSAQELAEREAMSTDTHRVLAYLEGPLVQSRLEAFVRNESKQSSAAATPDIESITTAIRSARQGKVVDSDALSIPRCMEQLQTFVDTAFTRIKRWQRSVSSRPVVKSLDIEIASNSLDSLTLNCPSITGSTAVVGVLVRDESGQNIIIRSLDLSDGATGSTLHKRQLIFDDNTEVSDAKLMIDGSILVLLKNAQQSCLIRIPWDFVFANDSAEDVYVDDNRLDALKLHVFDAADNFVPACMWLSEGKTRRAIIMDKKRRVWKILDLGRSSHAVNTNDDEDDDDDNDEVEQHDEDTMATDL